METVRYTILINIMSKIPSYSFPEKMRVCLLRLLISLSILLQTHSSFPFLLYRSGNKITIWIQQCLFFFFQAPHDLLFSSPSPYTSKDRRPSNSVCEMESHNSSAAGKRHMQELRIPFLKFRCHIIFELWCFSGIKCLLPFDDLLDVLINRQGPPSMYQ